MFSHDRVRAQLDLDLADHPDRLQLLEQFDRRSSSSLPSQYPAMATDDAAWQAAWEIRVIYGVAVPTMAPRHRSGPS